VAEARARVLVYALLRMARTQNSNASGLVITVSERDGKRATAAFRIAWPGRRKQFFLECASTGKNEA
jgi:hypothetical protein